MAVCVDCTISYSQLKNEIHRLESELRKKGPADRGLCLGLPLPNQSISHIYSPQLPPPSPHVSGGHPPLAGNDAHRLFTFICPPGGPSMRKERPLLGPGDRSHHQGCIGPRCLYAADTHPDSITTRSRGLQRIRTKSSGSQLHVELSQHLDSAFLD
ncbi:hypothetical protein GBF38_016727 [Nibea albiflora]|uniref:Uncharacterized protein n=1 Tax=Nibea albiflora TaxID=240163 RepID=A0ACB7FKC5_NIBAL|nr:hypothetical protein GBF38_016727 [Nibea albiflora]